MIRSFNTNGHLILLVWHLLVTLCGATSLFSQSKLLPSEQIDALFSTYSSETPGVAVGIISKGNLIFSRGYGSANLEYTIPITPKTIFHVASVSKQFTAFAIYLLKDQGLINLGDDIRKYIPELPDYGATIRIHHLLAHTSGLRDQWALLTLAGWQLEDIITTEQIVNLMIQQKALNFKPGTAFGYCNTSYTLLAEIVERVTGKGFSEFTYENIFMPLEMVNTQFYGDFHKVVKNRAYSYEFKDKSYVKKKLNYSNVGPTSLFTNVEDLVKWSNNFEKPIVGNKNLIAEFNEVATLDNGNPVIFRIINEDTLYHAKGQLLRNYRGILMLKHGGHDAGFRSFLARFPKERVTVITLSNDEHFEIFARGLEISEFYLKDEMTGSTPVPTTFFDNEKEEKQYDVALKTFVGQYSSEELSTTYTILVEDNELVIHHKRLPNMTLKRIGETEFSGNNYFDFKIDFLVDDTQKVNGFTISNFGVKNVIFNKI